jgi:hypothetical protein
MTLLPATILQPVEWCVARPQKDGHLLYSSRSDEMHLVPPTGAFAFQLCDGLRTIGEIEAELTVPLGGDRRMVGEALREFFEALVSRGLLEAAHV